MAIGHIIREFRTKAALRQEDLAKKSDVSTTYITMLEGGKRPRISLDVAQRIAKALNVHLCTLAGEIHDINIDMQDLLPENPQVGNLIIVRRGAIEYTLTITGINLKQEHQSITTIGKPAGNSTT